MTATVETRAMPRLKERYRTEIAGALRAIHWLAGQKPGRYTIEQSLGV